MKVDRQIIEGIVRCYLDDVWIQQDGQDMCSRRALIYKLVTELNRIDDITVRLVANDARLEEVGEAFNAEIVECDAERDKILDSCDHPSTKTYPYGISGVPDAQGNNESETICNICGVTL